MSQRQQVLYLWASGSALDSPAVGWAFHDGTDGTGPGLPEPARGEVPYATGVDALRDGWMLLQSAQLIRPPRAPNISTRTSTTSSCSSAASRSDRTRSFS